MTDILPAGVQLEEISLTDRLTLKPILNQTLPEYARDRDDHGYKNLFLDNVQVSDNIYRVGGFGGKFEDGYCTLINYVPDVYSKSVMSQVFTKENRHLSSRWCIINEEGEVKVQSENSFNNMYHLGGVLVSMEKRGIVNIETNEVIIDDRGSSLSSKNYYFTEVIHSISKKHESGIYKIEKATGEYEFFPR